MSTRFTELIDRLFEIHQVGPGVGDRADFIGVDRGTYSKLLSGHMVFTEKRAADFARKLAPPGASIEALAKEILETSRASAPPPTVDEFLESLVEQGGAVPAGGITQLFRALTGPGIDNALFCIEYRDLPRTVRGAKYADVGVGLGRAIADGLSVAMFMPFGIAEDGPPPGQCPSENTLSYMRRVRDECRDLHDLLLEEASREAKKTPAEFAEEGFLRLYERNPKSPYLGSGIGAKFGYIQFENEEFGTKVKHQRIVQWISSPKQDLIVYRGENQIPPDAIRDSLYPIPHYFHLTSKDPNRRPRLPSARSLSNEIDPAVFDEVDAAWSERYIPKGQREYWHVYPGAHAVRPGR